VSQQPETKGLPIPTIYIQHPNDKDCTRVKTIQKMSKDMAVTAILSYIFIHDIRTYFQLAGHDCCVAPFQVQMLVTDQRREHLDCVHQLGSHFGDNKSCSIRINPFTDGGGMRYLYKKRSQRHKSIMNLWYLIAHEMAHCANPCSEHHDKPWLHQFEAILRSFVKTNGRGFETFHEYLLAMYQVAHRSATDQVLSVWRASLCSSQKRKSDDDVAHEQSTKRVKTLAC